MLCSPLEFCSADVIHTMASWYAGSVSGELFAAEGLVVSSEEPARFSNCTLWRTPAGGALATAAAPGTFAMVAVRKSRCAVFAGVF